MIAFLPSIPVIFRNFPDFCCGKWTLRYLHEWHFLHRASTEPSICSFLYSWVSPPCSSPKALSLAVSSVDLCRGQANSEAHPSSKKETNFVRIIACWVTWLINITQEWDLTIPLIVNTTEEVVKSLGPSSADQLLATVNGLRDRLKAFQIAITILLANTSWVLSIKAHWQGCCIEPEVTKDPLLDFPKVRLTACATLLPTLYCTVIRFLVLGMLNAWALSRKAF